jgi:hypothetical protein
VLTVLCDIFCEFGYMLDFIQTTNLTRPLFDLCVVRVFAAMNLAVHTLMYSYYLLAALGQRPKWGEALTLGQTLQMVVGIWVLVVSMQTCSLTWSQNWHGTVAGLAMYFL